MSAGRYDTGMGSPRLERRRRRRADAAWPHLALGAALAVSCDPATKSGTQVSTSLDEATPPGPRRASAAVVTSTRTRPPTTPTRRPEDVDSTLQQAIDDSAAYLTRACGPSGRFVYRMRLAPDETVAPSYNVLRHAGSMYALAQVQGLWPRAEIAAAIGRASTYLWTYATPPAGQPDDGMLAVWSAKKPDVAKLGGAGLLLVAMGQLKAIGAELGDDSRVARVAAFVRSMQKPDGGFHSKHFRGRGPDDSWTSLYYPGEAALGLVLVGGDDNRRAATDALTFLARSRRDARRVPPDHWALIATGALLAGPVAETTRAELLVHARQVVDQILDSARAADGPLAGSWGRDGRTTPTATRLEGLIAAWDYLTEAEDEGRRARMRRAIEEGIAFLLRARVTEDPHRGAMPRSITWSSPQPSSSRADEVRIDYVQHALSAWIGWGLRRPGDEETSATAEPTPPADQRASSPGKSKK